MSSRKLADSGASKLSRSRQTSGDVSDLTETVTVARNKTFRLFPRDLARLRDLTDRGCRHWPASKRSGRSKSRAGAG